MGRHGHPPRVVDLELEAAEHRPLLLFGHVQPDQGGGAGRTERHHRTVGQSVVHVDRPGRLGAREVDEEPAREDRSGLGRVRVDAFLPLVRPLGAEGEPLGRAQDADRLEVCRLEQHLGRALRDLGVEPAHDRRERYRALPVRDQEVTRDQRPLGAVERPEALPLLRPPDQDPAAGELRAVEGVERAAPHVHDVVRHVDDVGDRAHAREVEARTEPLGRRPDRNAAEPAGDVPRAAAEVVDPDLEGLRIGHRGIVRFGRAQRPVAERRDLAGDPDQREEVGPVHGRRHVEHLVGERQDLRQGRPRLDRGGEQHDAGVVGAEADLVLGEDHPPRHLAPQLPLLERSREAGEQRARHPDGDGRPDSEVPRAADDLLRIGVADVDLAELEPIGVRMRIGGEHPPHDEAPEVAVDVGDAGVVDAVDLERRDREAARQVASGGGRLDVLPQPRERNPHQNCLAKRRSFRQSSRRSGNS